MRLEGGWVEHSARLESHTHHWNFLCRPRWIELPDYLLASNGVLRVVSLYSLESHLFRFLLASAHQCRPGRAVVRTSKRTLRPGLQRRMAGHRLDGGHLQGFLFVQRRQQPRQTAG